jgi:hypothetical protein
MKKRLVIAMLFVTYFLSAQNSVNQYQYVIVPTKFKFLNEPDEFRLNTLTKLLLEKYGFKVYYNTDELPVTVNDSRCNRLYVDVLSSGSLLKTKVQVTLKDCKNALVYKSDIGENKKNDLKVAYDQALREAFKSFEKLHYQYKPIENNEKNTTTIVNEPFKEENDLLSAETTANGYNLLDVNQKIIMRILKTSNPAIYTAIKGNVTGVLISKDNQWFFEYYQDEKPISEKINIKF